MKKLPQLILEKPSESPETVDSSEVSARPASSERASPKPVFEEIGSTSKVFVTPDKAYAIKRPSRNTLGNQTAFRREITILKSLKEHLNVVRLVGYVFSEENFLNKTQLTLEYANCHSLFDEVSKMNGRAPELFWSFHMLHGIAEGLLHLHTNLVLHGDIKLENILLHQYEGQPFQTPKLCDFGLSFKLSKPDEIRTSSGIRGTLTYLAPESLKPPYEHSTKTDVYALAVVMFSLATGRMIFPRIGEEEQIAQFVANGVRETIPAFVDPDLACAIRECWQQSANGRPSASNLVRFFSKKKGFWEASDASSDKALNQNSQVTQDL